MSTIDEQTLAAQKAKRAAQARINGALSKGPTTAAGKAASSQNAIRHGMTANSYTVLQTESLEEYDEVRSAFIASLRPADKAELRLVEKIANLDWRIERLAMMETTLYKLEADLQFEEIQQRFSRIDGIGIVVESWRKNKSNEECFALLLRYSSALQQQQNATLRAFRDLEKSRHARERAGLNLDEQNYQPPVFEHLLESELPQPEPEPQPQSTTHEPQSPQPPGKPNEPTARPSASPNGPTPHPIELPNEPTLPNKISLLPPATKRPAA